MSAEPKRGEIDRATIAIVVGASAFSVLALLDVFGSTNRVDLAVAGGLHRFATSDPRVTSGFLAVTELGNGIVLALSTVLVTGLLLAVGKRLLALGLSLSMAGVGIVNLLLKIAFQRARPRFDDPVTVADGWSFPSGHAMGTIVAVGMLTYIAFHWLEAPIGRRLLIAGVTLWVLLIGFSRMLLGVHYLSDVAGGLAAGSAWLALSIKAIERAKSGARESRARSHVKE